MADIVSLTSLNVLLIEDDPGDAAMIRAWMEEYAQERCHIIHVPAMQHGLDWLANEEADIVLLDMNLPDASGLKGLQRLQEAAPRVPVVILTGRDDEALALQALQHGAEDYLHKDHCDEAGLNRAIRFAIKRKQHVSELLQQANTDVLTGLANRVLLESRLDMAAARARRGGSEYGVLFLDLNDFKWVNDTLGHATGDQLLEKVAARLEKSVRPYDTAARFGGDEFVLLVEGIASPRDLAAVAQKIIENLAPDFEIGDRSISVGVSIGIATSFGKDLLSPHDLLKQADEAMYRAKGENSSAYHFYTPDMQDAFRQRMEMEEALRHAVENEELQLAYQPCQRLKGNAPHCMEALLRWQHPERGVLLPAEFIAIAEEADLLTDIGEWVIREVCLDMKRWEAMDFGALQVSVNVTSSQIESQGFVEYILFQLKQCGLRPDRLILEMPESVFLHINPKRQQALERLHALGMPICLDGFGAYLSSLNVLQEAVLTMLKLDGALVRRIERNPREMRLVQSIITCARELGLSVTASGVESEMARSRLMEQQCDAIQGFIYSRPMPVHFIEEWLKSQPMRLEAPSLPADRQARQGGEG